MAAMEDELRAILAAPAETLRLDFKREINWADAKAKLEMVRDVACMANRSGGWLVYGVDDRQGVFRAIGLTTDDLPPDVTELATLLARHLRPSPQVEVRIVTVDARNYCVVQVDEFPERPSICIRDGQTPTNVTVLRSGAIYQRTAQMQCAVVTPEGLEAIIDSAVYKTGAAISRLLGRPATPVVADEPPGAETAAYPMRALELRPTGATTASASLVALAQHVADATVVAQGGEFLPRHVNLRALDPGRLVRSPVGIQASSRDDESDRAIIDVTRGWQVRYRERLWEDDSPAANGMGIDITTLTAFAAASVEFGRRLYLAAACDTYEMDLGLLRPIGRRLVSDPARFTPFFQTYTATSPVDIWVRRDLNVRQFDEAGAGPAWLRLVIAELVDYFGWAMPEQSFEANLNVVRGWFGDIPVLRPLT